MSPFRTSRDVTPLKYGSVYGGYKRRKEDLGARDDYICPSEDEMELMDDPYYTAEIGYHRRIRLEYWLRSNSFMIVHYGMFNKEVTFASVTLADYKQILEKVEKINELIEEIKQGATLLFKYKFKEGTTITVDSTYPGILISSSASQSLKAHTDIYLNWMEWEQLLRLDLSERIPKLYVQKMSRLRYV